MLGENKWRRDKVNRNQVRELVGQKTTRLKKLLPDKGEGWKFHYAFFSRSGFTAAAEKALRAQGGLVINLQRLDADLA